mmetsp:Transcript_30570/g.30018  ORF Transcript_30570/g.30018 Transcript_30570/m.30018 type:complete len:123 (+) Transcript_30570:123-491(+)
MQQPKFLLQESATHPEEVACMLSFVPTFDVNPSQPQFYESALPFQDNLNQNEKETFIFIIDRSGSMEGPRMEMAKKALLIFLQSLPVGCRFEILSFGSNFQPMSGNFQGLEYNQHIMTWAKS